MVFDLSDAEKTLEGAAVWLEEALEANLNHQPLVFLVGTKKDLLAGDPSSVSSPLRLAAAAAARMRAELWAVSSKAGGRESPLTDLFSRAAALAFERKAAAAEEEEEGGNVVTTIGVTSSAEEKGRGDLYEFGRSRCVSSGCGNKSVR